MLAVALAALLAAPATWAAETLGHATSSTFPAGGPASAQNGGFGGPGGRLAAGSAASRALRRRRSRLRRRRRRRRRWLRAWRRRSGAALGRRRYGQRRPGPVPNPQSGRIGHGRLRLPAPWLRRRRLRRAGGFGGRRRRRLRRRHAPASTPRSKYAKAHGGGTIGVESQSTAAAAILANDADVAGLGGFSGRESTVSAAVAGDGGPRRPAALDLVDDGSPAASAASAATPVRAAAPRWRSPSGSGKKVTFTSNGTTDHHVRPPGQGVGHPRRGGPVMSRRLARRWRLIASSRHWPARPPASADSTQSSNWAGYAVHRRGVRFSKVIGTWTQPRATCTPGQATYSSVWVGIGGYRRSTPRRWSRSAPSRTAPPRAAPCPAPGTSWSRRPRTRQG